MASLAGSFLVARPTLQDPNFARAVVLLLAHTAEGAYGVVVNRPAAAQGLPFPVFVGGPCPAPGLVLLHGHAEWAGEASPAGGAAIAPGVFVGDAGCLERLSDPAGGAAARVRIFKGYAGWGPGQLEGELAAGAWAVAPASGALLFETPARELWNLLAPPQLPQPSLN